MEYQKLDPQIKKCWRLSRLIALLVILACALIVTLLNVLSREPITQSKIILNALLVVLALWQLLAFLIYPALEYRQWGYYLDSEKVIIRHGLFWIKENIIPIIRIQNVNIKQGPLKRHYGMNTLELQLASGDFVIEGLTRERAEEIANLLKSRLYSRVKERGGLPEQGAERSNP